jgi:hypothetical protein
MAFSRRHLSGTGREIKNDDAYFAPGRLCQPCHTDQVLVTPHLSLGGRPRMAPRTPDVSLLDDTVAPRILDAMRVASARLSELGVRHVLVGGLAVGAWGHVRATKDVDFLVGDEAFEHHAGGLVTMKYGVPIQVGGVAVDLLSASANDCEDALEHIRSGGLPVAPLPVLIYLKLTSPRPKDLADVMELIRLGIERDAIRADLAARSPEVAERWDRAIAEAWRGDE